MSLKIALLALSLFPLAPGSAFAQNDRLDRPVDVRPLLPPLQPFLPPNSLLTPGSVNTDPQSPYSSAPLFDPTRGQATPGLRLTIPTR